MGKQEYVRLTLVGAVIVEVVEFEIVFVWLRYKSKIGRKKD